MENGIFIDVANNTVIVQGENLIRNLFSMKPSYTSKDFSQIAHQIVKAKGHEFGITDPGDSWEWCLGTTNEQDAKLMMSFLAPEEADFVEAVSSKVGEPIAKDAPRLKKTATPKKVLH